MPDPVSIITLSVVGGLALIKLIKMIIKITDKGVISNCCVKHVDLHESNHHEQLIQK